VEEPVDGGAIVLGMSSSIRTPCRSQGVVCGVRVENIDALLMQKIRYLDRLVDELVKGRPSRRSCAA